MLLVMIIVLFAAITCYSSRKELRSKEFGQEALIRLGQLVDYDRIDPSRVVQLSSFLGDQGQRNSRHLQVLHYNLEDAEKNYNYFGNKSTLEESEPLLATFILYLSNVTRGGEILFPDSELKTKAWSGCGKPNTILRPTKGNAILFFNLHPNASVDKTSSHGKYPVPDGEMWCATKFIHAKAIPQEHSTSNSDNSDCIDEDDSCPRWADIGECQRNPVLMIGSDDYCGTCRKSCNVC